MRSIPVLMIYCLLLSCSEPSSFSLHDQLSDSPRLSGKAEYAESPFVAAGDRLYVVGHQDGTFPDLGWHVTGEMGGVWNHPIKLLDGYRLAIGVDGQPVMCLPAASKFYNLPFASQHVYGNVDGVSISSMVMVPDGLPGAVVEYQLTNTLQENKSVTVSFDAMVDLMPVWLSERKDIKDGKDSGYWDQAKNQLVVKDSLNTWYTLIGSNSKFEGVSTEAPCMYDRRGNGIDYSILQSFDLKAGEKRSLQYYISGSYTDVNEADSVLRLLSENIQQLVVQKQSRYSQLEQTHRLRSNDKQLDEMYQWVRYNTDWLMREVPEEGRGLSAGIPDYPWWFGTDNGYAIEGLLAYGMHEEALATIDLILKLSDKANGSEGQIMHEASTNGVVFNPGNLNTTPRFVSTLWNTYRWVGSDSLLSAYWPRVQKAMDWIEAQDHDGNGYPDGPGMMEIPGLHTEMIDVVAYQEQAYRHAARFAEAVKDMEKSNYYSRKSQQLQAKINKEWWSSPFQSFADFRATKKEAIKLTEAAIIRADTINKPWSVEELEATLQTIKKSKNLETDAYVVHHNWVVNTPMETGAADREKALLALNTAKNYRNRFGMFVTGIDRDEAQEEATQWKSFSYVGAVMTLPTAVQAIASANYGQIDDTYAYLKNLENSFSYALPGSMYEVSPDFGMIAQAWNAYAVAVPVVSHIAGIQPLAHLRLVDFAPQLPQGITELALDQVRVGDNLLDIELVAGEDDLLTATIKQTDPTYTIRVDLVEGLNYQAENINVVEEGRQVLLSGHEIELSWK